MILDSSVAIAAGDQPVALSTTGVVELVHGGSRTSTSIAVS
jgi:hypothetical protein